MLQETYQDLVDFGRDERNTMMVQHAIHMIDCFDVKSLMSELFDNNAVYAISAQGSWIRVVFDPSHRDADKGIRKVSCHNPETVNVFVIDPTVTVDLAFPKGFVVRALYLAKDGKWVLDGYGRSKCVIV